MTWYEKDSFCKIETIYKSELSFATGFQIWVLIQLYPSKSIVMCKIKYQFCSGQTLICSGPNSGLVLPQKVNYANKFVWNFLKDRPHHLETNSDCTFPARVWHRLRISLWQSFDILIETVLFEWWNSGERVDGHSI